MKILFYYILRRFFVSLEFSSGKISLTKGILLKRTSLVPFSAVVKVVEKRSPVLRLFRAKEVAIFTLNGKIEFFLGKNEQLPFVPKMPEVCVKPLFREILLGAFLDTRALAGIAFFAAVLRKIGSIFGSNYFDGIISAIFSTAEKISDALMVVHVAIPKAAAFAAVFALCSWIFAFAVKLLRLSGFRLSKRGDHIFVKSGVVTLYETALVRNTDAVITRKTSVCLFLRRSPVYFHRTLIYPAASEGLFERLLSRVFGILPEHSALVKTPPDKILGHCTIPLWCLGIASAALIAMHFSRLSSALLLKTALYCVIFVSGYITLCGIILMRRASSSLGERRVKLSFRRGTAVFCAFFPREISRGYVLSRNIFQIPAGLCDYKAFIIGRKSFRARQLPLKLPSKSQWYQPEAAGSKQSL